MTLSFSLINFPYSIVFFYLICVNFSSTLISTTFRNKHKRLFPNNNQACVFKQVETLLNTVECGRKHFATFFVKRKRRLLETRYCGQGLRWGHVFLRSRFKFAPARIASPITQSLASSLNFAPRGSLTVNVIMLDMRPTKNYQFKIRIIPTKGRALNAKSGKDNKVFPWKLTSFSRDCLRFFPVYAGSARPVL